MSTAEAGGDEGGRRGKSKHSILMRLPRDTEDRVRSPVDKRVHEDIYISQRDFHGCSRLCGGHTGQRVGREEIFQFDDKKPFKIPQTGLWSNFAKPINVVD